MNGNGQLVTTQKEEQSASSTENDSQEELLPNGQEMIEEINGSKMPGKFQEGGDPAPVKMRTQKCKQFDESTTLDDQNFLSALNRLAPTGRKEETEEEENSKGQCGEFESTSSR